MKLKEIRRQMEQVQAKPAPEKPAQKQKMMTKRKKAMIKMIKKPARKKKLLTKN
jgi:hypothetical protein